MHRAEQPKEARRCHHRYSFAEAFWRAEDPPAATPSDHVARDAVAKPEGPCRTSPGFAGKARPRPRDGAHSADLMTNGTPLGSHAILVFGAAVDHDGTPHRPLTLRLHRALAEAAADPRALVIVSRGRVRGRPAEAPVMREWLVAQGLDAARIVVEPEARSTYENARHCADLIAGQGVRRVTLVTERYHILRSRLLLARALAARRLRVEVRISAASDDLGFFKRITRCFKELRKLAGDLRRPW